MNDSNENYFGKDFIMGTLLKEMGLPFTILKILRGQLSYFLVKPVYPALTQYLVLSRNFTSFVSKRKWMSLCICYYGKSNGEFKVKHSEYRLFCWQRIQSSLLFFKEKCKVEIDCDLYVHDNRIGEEWVTWLIFSVNCNFFVLNKDRETFVS